MIAIDINSFINNDAFSCKLNHCLVPVSKRPPSLFHVESNYLYLQCYLLKNSEKLSKAFLKFFKNAPVPKNSDDQITLTPATPPSTYFGQYGLQMHRFLYSLLGWTAVL